MKKVILGLVSLFTLSGCYYYPGYYTRTTVGYYQPPDTIVYDSSTGREYICSPSERLDTCITRVCIQTTWGINNCVARTMVPGYIGVFPGVVPGVIVQGGVFLHHHHNGCHNHERGKHNRRIQSQREPQVRHRR